MVLNFNTVYITSLDVLLIELDSKVTLVRFDAFLCLVGLSQPQRTAAFPYGFHKIYSMQTTRKNTDTKTYKITSFDSIRQHCSRLSCRPALLKDLFS